MSRLTRTAVRVPYWTAHTRATALGRTAPARVTNFNPIARRRLFTTEANNPGGALRAFGAATFGRRLFTTEAARNNPGGPRGGALRAFGAATFVTAIVGWRLFSEASGDAGEGGALAAAKLEHKFRTAIAAFMPPSFTVWAYSASRNLYMRWLRASTTGRAADDAAVAARVAAALEPPVRVVGRAHGGGGGGLAVERLGLRFRNDLGNAAGFDKDGTLLELSWRMGAGFAVVGTVVSRPHTGNLPKMLPGGLGGGWNPWAPLPSSRGCLNSLGLPSHGAEAAAANIAAFRARCNVPVQVPRDRSSSNDEAGGGGGNGNTMMVTDDFPVGVSIMGHPSDAGDADAKLAGVLACVRALAPVADFLEVNESCPNVAHGHAGDGSAAAEEAALRARLTAVVRARDGALAACDADETSATGEEGQEEQQGRRGWGWGRRNSSPQRRRRPARRRVPVLVKLGAVGASPAAVEATVRLCHACGCDGVVAVNTQTNYAELRPALAPGDRALFDFYTRTFRGGVSGAPIRGVALAQAAAAADAARRLGLSSLSKKGGRPAFEVVHVGGVATREDVGASRAAGCGLREWYTGLMFNMATEPLREVYPRALLGEKPRKQ